MISIGRFAQLAQTSTRTIRFYESLGLIQASTRSEKNYRYYEESVLSEVNRIKELQTLGFTLEEIKTILKMSKEAFNESVELKLIEVNNELSLMQDRQQKLQTLLAVSKKIEMKQFVSESERKQYMEAFHEEIVSKLKLKMWDLNKDHLEYLNRDKSYHSNEQIEFIRALKSCIEFANKNNLRLGPVRGSASASLVNFALGLSYFDPSKHNLIPERLLTQAPNIHWDVEFERGQIFVDYCQELNRKLKFGQIQAFKMPLINIITNVENKLGFKPDYDNIDVNSDSFLMPFRTGQLEKIFFFDMSQDAMIMKFENFLPDYQGIQKLKEYFLSQPILNFRDVINIGSLWRPSSQQMLERLDIYKKSKEKLFAHHQLSDEIRESLESNFGMILYHEDLLRIIAYYTKWDFHKSNLLRVHLMNKVRNQLDHVKQEFPRPSKVVDESLIQEFRQTVSESIFQLVYEEAPYTFCLPHALSFTYFTKVTAILQSQYRKTYFDEIAAWESKFGYCWDDIGVKLDGISLLQS